MSFFRGFLSLTGTQALTGAALLAGRVLLARMLGPALMGAFGIALNAVTVGSRWFSLGIAPAAQHDAAKNAEEFEDVATTAIILTAAIGGLIVALAYASRPVLDDLLFSHQPEAGRMFWRLVPMLAVAALAMVATVLLLARGNIGRYNLSQLLPQLLFLPVAAVGAWWLPPGDAALAAQAALWISMLALSGISLARSFKSGRFRTAVAGRLLRFGVQAWPAVILQMGVARLAPLLAAPILATSQIGHFVIALSASEALLMLNAPITQLLFTRVSQKGEYSTELFGTVTRLTGLVLVLSAAAMALLGRLLFVPVFGRSFSDAYPMFLILLASAVAHGITRTHASYLSGRGKPALGSAANAVEAAGLVALVPIFAKTLGANGLAWAVAASAGAGLLVSCALASRLSQLPLIRLLVPARPDLQLAASKLGALRARGAA